MSEVRAPLIKVASGPLSVTFIASSFGYELRDGKLGGRIQAPQTVRFEILAGLQQPIDVGRDVLQQHRLLPVDRLRRYIEREIGDEAPHLLQIGAAHPVLAHPERLVDGRWSDDDPFASDHVEHEHQSTEQTPSQLTP